MRVLMVSGEYPPRAGGVGDYTARLSQALRGLGHDVTVLTSVGQGAAETEPGVWRAVADWGFRSWGRIEAALDRSGADLAHIQYQPGAFQLKGAVHLLPFWLRRRRPRVRVVTTFHDLRIPYLFPKAGVLRELAVGALVRGSRGAIFVDPLDLARAGRGPGRRWVPIGSNIPCAPPADFDRQAQRRLLGVMRDDFLIGFFGFLTSSKGADCLLRALRLLRERRRAARLVLIGAGAGTSNPTDRADQAAALELASELDLSEAIVATGYLEPVGVSAHLLACDAVALPYLDGASFRRGSLLAALEHGCAVVSTAPRPGAEGRAPRALVAGRNLMTVPVGDPAALADALTSLADHRALGAILGSEARALAGLCGWEAIARETEEVYEEALARTPSPCGSGPA